MKETCVSANEIDWQPAEGYPEGALRKVLHEGSDSTPRSILLKIGPGWMMHAHAHPRTELQFVLEGEYESGDQVFPARSYRVIPRHTDHGPFTTITGAVVLVIWLDDL